MSSIDRRHFLKFAGATSVAAALPFPFFKSASALPLATPSLPADGYCNYRWWIRRRYRRRIFHEMERLISHSD